MRRIEVFAYNNFSYKIMFIYTYNGSFNNVNNLWWFFERREDAISIDDKAIGWKYLLRPLNLTWMSLALTLVPAPNYMSWFIGDLINDDAEGETNWYSYLVFLLHCCCCCCCDNSVRHNLQQLFRNQAITIIVVITTILVKNLQSGGYATAAQTQKYSWTSHAEEANFINIS